jgi:hypothetical protein
VTTTETLLKDLEIDAPVREVLIGAFWTLVTLDTEPVRCGLASTLRGETSHEGPPIPEAGRLLSYSGQELTAWLGAEQTLKASVGLAAYNALLEPHEDALVELNASQVIIEQGAGGNVAIIGHFPFVEEVRRAVETCWVLELRPRPGDLPADHADEILPRADVVAVTSTSLLNHTFDALIDLCRDEAFVVMLGPSTPLTPTLLSLGVDVLSGTIVDDPERVRRSIMQGATFRQVKRGGGLRLVSMAYER